MTNQNHVIIYVTGLNDHRATFQKIAIKTWRFYGVQPLFFRTGWADNATFAEKLERLLDLIDANNEQGNKVSLIGVSAGASIVVAAFARRKNKINGVAFVCGKLRNPQTVSANYYLQNPAFREAMSTLNDNLAKLTKTERARMMSIYPLFDETVVITDTFITGAKKAVFPTLLHVPTIALSISVLSFVPIFFLKRLAKG
jgi:pimeloyl-ACP methyl ester carboxylesterase